MNKPHKVLMTLMGMEIGGAETHVLELSKTLKQMGLDVYVVSNGGVYVKELEECGIKHYRVPLHNKQFINVFSSYKALKKIILENDIQLVHAHARIPAFICGMLQKRLKFKLVTSAHGAFSVAFPFNLLSNWGDRVLAVSDDLKSYLMANYKVEESGISLTVNGIDTTKFSPEIDANGVIEELGLQKGTRKIVSISRMDKDSSLPPQILVDIAEKLNAHHNIEIILVGDGEDFDAINSKAQNINKKLGKKLIHITGRRTDVNKFMALADVFVNVARASMEALASGTPTILAGTYGYLGIFDEKTKQAAIDTNFTCRGAGEITGEKLIKDIEILLNKPAEEVRALGQYSRNLICSEYSLERMGKDAIDVYDKVFETTELTRVIISGYYGYNNSGDDIMLHSIVQDLRANKDNLSITVLSLKPKETRAKFMVDAVHRFNLFSVFFRLRRAKLLITGGGNLIQDETSTQSLIYYLWVINTARFFGVKNMLYAKGIGPVNRPLNVKRVQKSLNKVDLITLREGGSLEVLKEMNISQPEIHITADAAFALPQTNENGVSLNELGIVDKFFCVALRPWAHNPADFEIQMAEFADYLVDTYAYQAVFVPMRPEQDSDIAHRVIAQMKNPAIFVGSSDHNVGRAVLGLASFAVCMRLHALIYAMEKGVPAIGLVYSPKIRRFMEAMGQDLYVRVEDTRVDILKNFACVIHSDMENISQEIYKAGLRLRELAAENVKLCIKLLDEAR